MKGLNGECASKDNSEVSPLKHKALDVEIPSNSENKKNVVSDEEACEQSKIPKLNENESVHAHDLTSLVSESTVTNPNEGTFLFNENSEQKQEASDTKKERENGSPKSNPEENTDSKDKDKAEILSHDTSEKDENLSIKQTDAAERIELAVLNPDGAIDKERTDKMVDACEEKNIDLGDETSPRPTSVSENSQNIESSGTTEQRNNHSEDIDAQNQSLEKPKESSKQQTQKEKEEVHENLDNQTHDIIYLDDNVQQEYDELEKSHRLIETTLINKECPICLGDHIVQPTTLPCGHCCCARCLRKSIGSIWKCPVFNVSYIVIQFSCFSLIMTFFLFSVSFYLISL